MISALRGRLVALARSNAAVYVLGTILSRIGAIVLIPLYTRRLTQEDYGEYALAVSIQALLPTVGSLGLSAGISRVYFGTSDRDEANRAIGAVARGMVVVTAATLGLLAVIVALQPLDVLFGLHRRYVLLAVAASFGIAMFSIPNTYFRAAQRPRSAVAIDLSMFLLTAGLGALFVVGLGRGLSGALEASAISTGLVGLFAIGWILFRLPSRAVGGETRTALGFSLAFVPHHIASWIQLTADRWVLTAFGAPAMLGTYYLGVQILSPVAMLVASWNDSEAARHGEIYRDGGIPAAYAALPRMYRSYALAAAVPCALVLLGSPLLPWIVGPRFASVTFVLPLLAAAAVFDALYYPAANYVFYAGKTASIPIVTAVSAVLGLGAAILLLPRFGLYGLLAARVFASALRSGAMYVAARRARP